MLYPGCHGSVVVATLWRPHAQAGSGESPLHIPKQSHGGAKSKNTMVPGKDAAVIAPKKSEEHGDEGLPAASPDALYHRRRRRCIRKEGAKSLELVSAQGRYS